MVEDINLPCGKWHSNNSDIIVTSNSFSFPLLLFNAREDDDTKVKLERAEVRKTLQYQSLASPPLETSAAQQQLLDQIKQQVLHRRYLDRTSGRGLAHVLGYPVDANGCYRWESSPGVMIILRGPKTLNRPGRFLYGTNCVFCGLTGHDIAQCPEFLSRYRTWHGRDYQPPVAAPVPAPAAPVQTMQPILPAAPTLVPIAPAPRPISLAAANDLDIPAEGRSVKCNFEAFATPRPDGTLVLDIRSIIGGDMSGRFGKIEIVGKTLGQTSMADGELMLDGHTAEDRMDVGDGNEVEEDAEDTGYENIDPLLRYHY